MFIEELEFAKRKDDGRTCHAANLYIVIPLMGRFKHETGERNSMVLKMAL